MIDRHFALVVLIPLLMIGAFYYAGKNEITGFVVQEEDAVIGQVFYAPQIKLSKGFSEAEYLTIKAQLKGIIESCRHGDMKACIGEKTQDWKCQPFSSEEAFLDDIAEKINNCLLVEDGRICLIEPMNNMAQEGSVTIASFYREEKKVASRFLDMQKVYYTGFEEKDREGTEAESISIEIDDFEVSGFFAIGKDGHADLNRRIIAYKNETIKFIDSAEEKSFESSGIPIVRIEPSNGTRFCAKSANSNLVYKFAVKFG
jgi:hypothetical protein